MMYKLSRRFFDDKWLALLPVVFYAYSQVGFNTVLYIRGYLMQTLWAVCLMYETVCLLQEKDVSKKRWFLIFLFSLSGMLTQYNSIIYSAIIGIVIGFGLLWQKRYNHLIILAMVMVLSLCSLFVIFPDAINVLLHSSRATEISNISLSDKLMNFLDPWGKTKNLILIYTTALWSFREVDNYMLLVCIFLPLAYKYIYTKADRNIDFLIVIYVLMCLYSEFFMPEMYIYNMRYVMLVVPLIAIATIWYLSFILQNLKIKNLYLKLFLCSVVFVNALFVDFENRSPYAFSENVYKKISLEGNVLVIVGESIFAYESINVLGNTDEVYMVMDSVPEEMVVREMNKANYVIKSNTDARFDMTIKPEKPAEIFSSTIDKVDFEKTIKVGERFYDIYHIRRKIFDE